MSWVQQTDASKSSNLVWPPLVATLSVEDSIAVFSFRCTDSCEMLQHLYMGDAVVQEVNAPVVLDESQCPDQEHLLAHQPKDDSTII